MFGIQHSVFIKVPSSLPVGKVRRVVIRFGRFTLSVRVGIRYSDPSGRRRRLHCFTYREPEGRRSCWCVVIGGTYSYFAVGGGIASGGRHRGALLKLGDC